MPQKKLTVDTAYGTFSRRTARTYTHLVVVGPIRFEVLEARRLADIRHRSKEAARYRLVVATGQDPTNRPAGTIGGDWDRECSAKYLADGSYLKWAEEAEAHVRQLTDAGPFLKDEGSPRVAGWCGRLDLARKLAAQQTRSFRFVAIIEVATGTEVK